MRRRTDAEAVMVAVSTTVVVRMVRCVAVWVVVTEELVVTVLGKVSVVISGA